MKFESPYNADNMLLQINSAHTKFDSRFSTIKFKSLCYEIQNFSNFLSMHFKGYCSELVNKAEFLST